MAKSRKLRRYPNKETERSYFMQAIEPNNADINVAFPGYHPMWVIQSQKMSVSGGQFKFLREVLLRISREQCAAYLEVSEFTIRAWETNLRPIGFMAFELLRLIYESAHFKLSHKDWQSWFISQDGRLVCSDTRNLSFTPDELIYVRQIHQQKSFYETEAVRLRAEIEPLRVELAELRKATGSEMLDELKAIETKLADLASSVSNSKVVRIGKSKKANYSLEAKVA